MAEDDSFDDTDIVLRRPHFRLVADALFFLVSRRPHLRLSPAEVEVWTALDGEPTVGAVRANVGEQGWAALRRLREQGVCEIAESRWPEGRRRIIVFEPHSDDAALSVGGAMWAQRYACEFVIATLASRSNFTSYFYLDRDFFLVDEISALRNAEAVLCARLLGGRHLALRQAEATLRYRDCDWSLEWFRRHRLSVAAFIDHRSGDAELLAWTKVVSDALHAVPSEEVWVPIGVGSHTDHELARNACLSALTEDPSILRDRTVRLYQEVPYAAGAPRYTETLVRTLEDAGAKLIREPFPLTAGLSNKLRLVSVFASQFKTAVLRPDIETSARLAAGHEGGLAELQWRIEKAPARLDVLSLYIDEPLIRRSRERLSAWASRHRNAKRIRLLLVVAAGRWAEDVEVLLKTFAGAHLDVYVTRDASAEIEERPHDRVRVHRVGGGPRAWLQLGLRLALSWPAPIVFLSGWKRPGAARALGRLWALHDPVVLPTLDHFILALREARLGPIER